MRAFNCACMHVFTSASESMPTKMVLCVNKRRLMSGSAGRPERMLREHSAECTQSH